MEIENHAAECAIRVLRRRNFLFAGWDAGGDAAGRLYGLVGRFRWNSIDPNLYRPHVLESIAIHPVNHIGELLPWRVGPLEDVGGPHSYFEFLAAIKDPTLEEHNSLLEWIGGSFDPAAFDITDVNERLAEINA